jgi:hypothetical protein
MRIKQIELQNAITMKLEKSRSLPTKPSAEVVPEGQKECIVCLEDDKVTDYIFVPCGHGDVCEDCGKSCKLCPVCRTDINQLIRIYP